MKTCLAPYKAAIADGKIKPFDLITIIQKEQEDNIIYKDDYNFLAGLLRKDGYPTIYFDFNGAWNGGPAKETIWEFNYPLKASKDIKANVSYEEAEVSRGLKMKLGAVSYPAEFTAVRIQTSKSSEAGSLFDRVFGEIRSSQNNITVATSLGNAKDVYPMMGYYSADGLPETAQNLTLRVGNLQRYGKNEIYLLHSARYKESFAVAKEGGYQVETAKTPDGDVTWQGYNTYYASLTAGGLLTPIREVNEFCFYACYQSGGKPVTEVYHAPIERRVIGMKFSNASLEKPITMEMIKSSTEGYSLGTLSWVTYPAGMMIVAEELDWSVEGNAVEVSGVSGNNLVNIKTVSPGEAVVTATYKNDSNVSASVKVIVKPSIWDEVELLNKEFWAVSGIHKTLKDLNAQLPKGVAWENPDMSLAGFKDCIDVPVVYTSEDGRTAEFDAEVSILTFEGIDLKVSGGLSGAIEDGDALQGGEKIYFDNRLKINKTSVSIDEFNAAENYGTKYQLSVVPAANTKNLVKESDNTVSGQYIYESSTASTGKKAFSFEMHLSDVSGNTLGVVSKATASMTITKEPVINWTNVTISRLVADQTLAIDAVATTNEKGSIFIMQKGEYIPLTAKSLDGAVCKIVGTKVDGENYVGEVATIIDYEVKKGGRVYIQLTASDEAKSTDTIRFNAEDIMPRAEQSAVTIDKARKDTTANVKWQLYSNTSVGKEGTVSPYTINGQESTDFTVTVVNTENAKAQVKVALKNVTIKNGKYKLQLQAPITYGNEKYATPFETEIVVTIKDTKPVATIKQTKKYNTLYKSNEGFGTFAITTKGDWTIEDITLENQSDTKKCDYVIQRNGDIVLIGLKDGGDPKNTKGKLVITTNEYASKKIEKNVTIATESKKPVIALSKKTETIYTVYKENGMDSSAVEILNKTTANKLYGYELQIKEGNNWVTLEAESDHSYTANKNKYTINHKDGVVTLTLNTETKGTDKFKFRVKQNGWKDNNYTELAYSIKVETGWPKLVTANSTLTLNKNESVYKAQLAKTRLTLKGGDNYFDKNGVFFEGVGAKDETVRNKYLNFKYVDGNVCVSFNDSDKDLATGKYKFDVQVFSQNTGSLYTTLTVNVVDVPLQKCLKLQGKGKIDILNREDTAITYTVKTSNLQGTLFYSSLTGADANKFYVAEAANGKIVVKAKQNAAFSTKVTYKVVPILYFENEDGKLIVLKADAQKITVKQGKPKVSITPADGAQNVLYRDRNNALTLDVKAVLSNKNVRISKVELTNYTSDLSLECNYDLETGVFESITLSQHAEKQILLSGKTWKLKFNVYFADAAGNEKTTQVTYGVVVQ